MMTRVWKYGLAALGGAFVACSGGGSGDVAGSSMETENSIAYSVVLADGSPAAQMRVRVRPVDFVAAGEGVDALDSSLFIDDTTDSNGFISISSLIEGDYRIEVGNDSLKGTDAFAVKQNDGKIISDSLSITVDEPGRVVGQVELPEGQKYAMVAIVGLDYYAKTDSLGFFEFESLPAGEFEVLALSDSYASMGSVPAEVESGDSVEVLIELPADTVKHFMLDDFEDGVDNWFVRHSEYGEGELLPVKDKDDARGIVAYFNCKNDSNLNWALFGYGFDEKAVDMSELDSIVFWARGLPKNDSVGVYLSFSFDVNVDSSSGFESGKAWVHMDLTEEWSRYVVKPSILMDPDSNKNGGNIGWDAVKSHVTNISIFGGIGGKIWVDDIEVFGYNEFVGKELKKKDD
ncbi:MAG: carboxypeptidase-like regulatory domain-containing protein [Fibrobacter sp.]|nr:carboxypeptidase-like regulatory domain-containing protein [Fibrobacter sp.]